MGLMSLSNKGKIMFSYTNLSPEEAQLIWNALSELPAKASFGLLNKLKDQLTEQGAFAQAPALPPIEGQPT
jgi:hypothetical protein